jgi:hypothetical protein
MSLHPLNRPSHFARKITGWNEPHRQRVWQCQACGYHLARDETIVLAAIVLDQWAEVAGTFLMLVVLLGLGVGKSA